MCEVGLNCCTWIVPLPASVAAGWSDAVTESCKRLDARKVDLIAVGGILA